MRYEKENNTKPLRNELHLDINGVVYKICSINIDTEGEQFYYHFDYPRNLKNKIYDYKTEQLIGRPDHISFHKDGQVHLKFRGDSRERFKELFADNSFLPLNKDNLTPLLIHSYFQHDEFYMLRETKDKKDKLDPNLQVFNNKLLAPRRDFSIILFLSPAKRTIEEVLSHPIIIYSSSQTITTVGSLGQIELRIPAWKDFVIDCMVTDLVLRPRNAPFTPIYESFAYIDLHLALSDLFLQRFKV